MKNSLIFILILSFSSVLCAQNERSRGSIPESYDRNSMTLLFVDNANIRHWTQVKTNAVRIDFSDKYDNHNLENMFYKPSFNRGGVLPTQLAEALRKDLEKNSTGRSVISKWYNRKPDGTMDMELVHQRGRFSATDADYLVATSSRRGDAALQDFGNRLVNRSYILVVDLSNVQTMEEADAKDLKGWRAEAAGYLFKIDFNDEIRNAFYDTWIYDDDTEDIKSEKRRAFNQLNIPIEFVASATANVRSTQTKRYGTKSNEQLMQELVQKAYDELIFNIETQVDDFRVTTALYARRPLRAKIGLKEGLKTDYRFFVYEHVYNSRTNSAEPVRRGVIRVAAQSKIHDNRHEAFGDMGTSQFYQVSGRRLHEGYTLVQKNDFGLEITLGAESGGVGGGYGRLDLRTGRFSGVKALFVYIEAGLDSDNYTLLAGDDFSMLRVGGGIAKGMQLTRNSELRPYIGLGVEGASNDVYKDDDALQAYYFRLGANLALNLSHNFQFLLGAGSYAFVTNAENESGNAPDVPWTDLFPDRGGMSLLFGVKFMF